RLGEIEDLQKSIEHKSRALVLTPDGHPDLSLQHADLGVSYTDRFRHVGEVEDLAKSIEHHSRALSLTPDGHPDSPGYYHNQAQTFFLQYQHTGDPSHLKHALVSFRIASRLSTGAPRQVFNYALNWAQLATHHSSLNCIEAYHATMNLLPQFIWFGASTSQRYQDLLTTESLAVRAASAAIHHSDPRLALKWLEHARCVVWNQTLMLRSPLDKLRSSHPDLAARLQEVSKHLHDAGYAAPCLNQQLAAHLTMSSWASTVVVWLRSMRARNLPGFENLLQPMNADALVHAARHGPIVVINCYDAHCDALLVLPRQGDIHHLPLPNFSEKKARHARSEIETSLRRQWLRERGVRIKQGPDQKDPIGPVLTVLWEDIIKPILDYLGYMNDDLADSMPHITWCPTGAMSFLPLHAAGDYEQPRSRVFDYAISSYTPTLTALLASNPSSLNHDSSVLTIGQASTPGRKPLPGTIKELAYVKAHTENKARYSELVDSQATTSNILDAMEQHDWIHLACHAHQNVDDPTKSGFFLHDGTLDLAAINRRSFKNKGLAFLSACQTATGDEKLPDEAIHLASGMLMAGYPSVIATMWSVMDDDAPLVADKVYAELMKEGKVGNGEAGKALHYAVAELHDKVGEKSFARWAPYIHIGS
ncbi:hypothetical protein FRC11_007141, partial [Ceratobasidium sp. 423]